MDIVNPDFKRGNGVLLSSNCNLLQGNCNFDNTTVGVLSILSNVEFFGNLLQDTIIQGMLLFGGNGGEVIVTDNTFKVVRHAIGIQSLTPPLALKITGNVIDLSDDVDFEFPDGGGIAILGCQFTIDVPAVYFTQTDPPVSVQTDPPVSVQTDPP